MTEYHFDTPPPFDLDDLPKFLEGLPWREAKSYRHGELAHEYVGSAWSDEQFDAWVWTRWFLARLGYRRRLGRYTFTYLDLPDGFTYWVMPKWVDTLDAPLTEGDPRRVPYILNRQATAERPARLRKDPA